jgi:cytochrome P450
LLQTANNAYNAGADTVGATAQAFVYYLLRHPNYLQRLRDEIDTAQDRDELSPMVQYNEAQRLPFLQACVSILLQAGDFSYLLLKFLNS